MVTQATELATSMLRGRDVVILTQRQKAYLVSVARRSCPSECTAHDGGWFIGPYTLLRGGRLARTDREAKAMDIDVLPCSSKPGCRDSFILLMTEGRKALSASQVTAAKDFAASNPTIAQAFYNVRDEIDNETDRQIVSTQLGSGCLPR